MSKNVKELMIEELSSKMRQSSALFLAGFVNMPAVKMNKLRKVLKDNSSHYVVVKNSICRLALQHCQLDLLAKAINGPTCMTLVYGDDVSGVVRTLVNFAKENEGLKIQCGHINGKVVSIEEIKELASLPPRGVLIGQVICNIKSPLACLVLILGENLRRLNLVLTAISRVRSGGESNG